MLLSDKHVLVFAASGAIGGQVARTCADHGATVWLSARRGEAAEKLAAAITETGGRAHAVQVDATDQAAVDAYVAETAASAGRIDAVFNGIGARPADLAYPRTLADLDLDGFLRRVRGPVRLRWHHSTSAERSVSVVVTTLTPRSRRR